MAKPRRHFGAHGTPDCGVGTNWSDEAYLSMLNCAGESEEHSFQPDLIPKKERFCEIELFRLLVPIL